MNTKREIVDLSAGKKNSLHFAVCVLFLCFLFSSCSSLEFSGNPYDPATPASAWAPRNLVVSQATIRFVNLKWEQGTQYMDSSRIESKVGDGIWKKIGNAIGADPEFNDFSFVPDTLHTIHYRIKALAGSNESGPAENKINPVFPFPTNLTISPVGEKIVTLNWKDNSTGEDGFRIDRKVGSNPWTLSYGMVTEEKTVFTDSNVPFETIEYRVYAFRSGHNSRKTLVSIPFDDPRVVLGEPTEITAKSVKIAVSLTEGTRLPLLARGVCYSHSPNPTTADSVIYFGGTTNQIELTLSNLFKNKLYYIRAFVSNSKGIFYSTGKTFQTLSGVPVMDLLPATLITKSSGILNGTVKSANGLPILSMGFCWSTKPNPTVLNDKQLFSTVLSGAVYLTAANLNLNTLYYYRIFITNSAGTYYSNELNFKTLVAEIKLSTNALLNITVNSATAGLLILDDGGEPIIEKGICYALNGNPLVTNNKVIMSTGSTVSLSGLNHSTKYYIRAYATNKFGTFYGDEISFVTLALSLQIKTYQYEVMTTSARLGGEIVSGNGLVITERGLCYNTTGMPKIADQKQEMGSGAGDFYTVIMNLSQNTHYFFRAYLKCSFGDFYGNEISFVTNKLLTLPALNTLAVNNVSANTAKTGINITDTGGSPISSSGICWDTKTNPENTLSTKKIIGKQLGMFEDTIKGLVPNTVYYVRAFATNETGTVYGDVISFKTKEIQVFNTVEDIDGNIYNTIQIGTQVWMLENLKTTHLNDGSRIPNMIDNQSWFLDQSGAFCIYAAIPDYSRNYGLLYNWHAVNTGKLSPKGWHIPTDAEWTVLETYLGGANVAGGKIKSTQFWLSPNTAADNYSGLSAVPAGYRVSMSSIDTYFEKVTNNCIFYSATEETKTSAYARKLSYNDAAVNRIKILKSYGCSVRCIKN